MPDSIGHPVSLVLSPLFAKVGDDTQVVPYRIVVWCLCVGVGLCAHPVFLFLAKAKDPGSPITNSLSLTFLIEDWG